MASLITSQFERYVAEQTIAQGTVVFDEFIFANIPNLNANNLAQHLTMPTAAQIVHRQAVSQSGVINENAVVYSVTIGTEVGDFDFNFIGLINKSKNLLAVAVQTDPVRKTRNKNAVQGNSITRNILLEFSGAKALTGINVSAQTWQIDFTVRLHGLDEKIRLTNRDLYGRAVFFDDSFLVQRKTGNQFTIKPGVAYVEGVRMDSTALYNLTANSLPCSVYADVVHHCTVTGEYKTEIKYLTQSKADYVDTANRQHYVQILADIDRSGNVTDRRLLSPFLGITPLELSETTVNHKDSRGHTHKLPIAGLVKRGITKLFSGYDSDSEDMAATPKAIKGLKALIDAITRNLGNYIPNSKKSNATNSASSDTVATSAAVKYANDNANGRVSKSGDTMTGNLTINTADSLLKGQRNGEDKYAIGLRNSTSNDVVLVNYTDNTELELRSNSVYSNKTLISTGMLLDDSDYSGLSLKNASGRYVRIEGTPHSSSSMLSFVYREANGNNINTVSLQKKGGTVALLEDIRNVNRRDYNRTIKGTNDWDNGKQKDIAVSGQVITYPDGRIQQILHLKHFRMLWFAWEDHNIGYSWGDRGQEIFLQLWSAMPNRIVNIQAIASRSTNANTSTCFYNEAGEFVFGWNLRKQGNNKDRIWLNAARNRGGSDEFVDLYIVVEGY